MCWSQRTLIPTLAIFLFSFCFDPFCFTVLKLRFDLQMLHRLSLRVATRHITRYGTARILRPINRAIPSRSHATNSVTDSQRQIRLRSRDDLAHDTRKPPAPASDSNSSDGAKRRVRWRRIATGVIVGCGVFIAVGNDEVPYTNRRRVLLVPMRWDQTLGHSGYQSMTQKNLPKIHPVINATPHTPSVHISSL